MHTPGPWTFTSNADGYMFYFEGKPTGGAGTIARDRVKPRHWSHVRADAKEFREYSERECDRRNAEHAKAHGQHRP